MDSVIKELRGAIASRIFGLEPPLATFVMCMLLRFVIPRL